MPAPRFVITHSPATSWTAAASGLLRSWAGAASRADVMLRYGLDGKYGRLGLQSLTWNRAGVATRVGTRVVVLDEALMACRQAHPASTVLPVSVYAVWPHVFLDNPLLRVPSELRSKIAQVSVPTSQQSAAGRKPGLNSSG